MSTAGPELLQQALRTATAELHEAVEACRFSRRLFNGEVQRDEYVRYLTAMRTVHARLECHLDRLSCGPEAELWAKCQRRSRLLDSDLAYFEPAACSPETVANRSALALADQFGRFAERSPIRLLGALYVLEGSSLGGQVLKSRVARALALDGEGGLSYFAGAGARTAHHWRAFVSRLNALELAKPQRSEVLAGAVATFRGIHAVLHEIGATLPIAESCR